MIKLSGLFKPARIESNRFNGSHSLKKNLAVKNNWPHPWTKTLLLILAMNLSLGSQAQFPSGGGTPASPQINPFSTPLLGNPFRRNNGISNLITLREELLLNNQPPAAPGSPQLQWPPLPRILLRPFDGEIQTTELTWGLSGFVPLPFPLSSSLAAQRNKKFEESAQSALNMWIAGNDPDVLQEREYRPGYLANFVRNGEKVVGACELTVSVQRETGIQIASFLAGNGAGHRDAKLNGSSITVLSELFQVMPDIPLFVYQEACDDWYSGEVQEDARKTLHQIVKEKEARISTDGSCQPGQIGAVSRPEGDRSCETWFEARVPKHLREKTVPRCEHQPDLNVFACTAKYKKEGQLCPLYWTSSGISPQKLTSTDPIVSPRGFRDRFDCDEASGLSCEVVDPDLLQNPHQISGWKGLHQAFCIKKTP